MRETSNPTVDITKRNTSEIRNPITTIPDTSEIHNKTKYVVSPWNINLNPNLGAKKHIERWIVFECVVAWMCWWWGGHTSHDWHGRCFLSLYQRYFQRTVTTKVYNFDKCAKQSIWCERFFLTSYANVAIHFLCFCISYISKKRQVLSLPLRHDVLNAEKMTNFFGNSGRYLLQWVAAILISSCNLFFVTEGIDEGNQSHKS